MSNEHGREETEGNQPQTEESKTGYSVFGNALMCLILALLLFTAPSYFDVSAVVSTIFSGSVGSTVGAVLSVVCYLGAVIFAFYTASFILSAFNEHPELKSYLRHLFGGSADAWESAFGALAFTGIALVIHLAAIVVFGVTGVASILLKVVVYFFGFMGLILGVSALDSLIFKPFLHNLSERPDREALSRRAKTIGVAVGSVIVSLATLLAALNELMN